MAQDTAHAKQGTERAHRWTGAKWPRTPHMRHNTPSGHTGEQEPSGSGRRTAEKWPRTPHTQSKAPSGHTGGQEPSGSGHRIPKATHRAGTPVNRSQVAEDTAYATQHTELAHRLTGAKWPGTPHEQSNALSGDTGEQEPSVRRHRRCNTRNHAGTPVNRSQVAKDTVHATQHTERAHR